MIRANRLFHLRRSASRSVYILSAILVVAIGIGIYSYFLSKSALASWFNESWLYRSPIAITNSSGSNQTDFQVSFTLDTATLITAGKMLSNCNDLRITDISGKLLPQWIEENNPGCNNAATKVWVKVPSIATAGQTLYVYYGNASAPKAADPNRVFEFFDDFNQTSINTSKWATSGSPTASSGVLNLSNSGALSSLSTVSDTTNTRTLGFRAKTTSASVETARFGYSNTNTLSTAYYNDDSAHIVMGKEETYLANKGSTNLVSHHKLEETTSTDANQFKASGYLDTGKLSQAASVYGNAAGTSGSILTFNRGTQISGNNYEHLNTNQGTISFWVKPSWNGNDGVKHVLFDAGIVSPATDADGHFSIYKDTSNNLNFHVNNGNNRAISTSISSWTSGTWYYVTATWDQDQSSDTLNLAVNGTEASDLDEAISIVYASGTRLYIGSDSNSQNQAQALIDDFAIFDRVLSSTEITSLYNSGTGASADIVADSNLKFLAKLDGSGTLSPITYNLGTNFDQTAYNSSTNTNGNLVADGNMEGADTSSWTASLSTLSKDTTAANVLYDAQVLKITNSGANWGRAQQAVTGLSAGDDFSFSIWGNNGTAGGIRIRVYSGTAASPTATTVFDKNTSSAGWVNFEGTVEVQAGHDRLTVEPLTNTNTDGQYSLWDNATLYKNLVNNGGTEGTLTDAWTQETNATMATDTSEHSGSQEMKITAGAANVGASQAVTLVNTTYYLVSGWARATSGDTATIVMDKGDTTTQTIGTVTATSYTKIAGVFRSTGTAGVIYLRASANTDIVWFDDISITPLDNTALTFQSWAPASDAATADNDLSVQGDSDGVASNTSGKYGNAYTFDGATGYLRQKTYDVNIGTITYEDTNTDIKDTGQEFGDWDNAGGTGSAEYMIVVTNSDNTTSWGYFCAEDAGTQTAVYTLKACTGGSEGFNGTSPSGKTPVGYEIRKTDYQITGNFTMGAWIYNTNGNGDILSKNSPRIWVTDADASIRFTSGGTESTAGASSLTLSSWTFVVGTFDGTNNKLYVNGALVDTDAASAPTDVANPIAVAARDIMTSKVGFFAGRIDSPFVIADDLTAAQVKELYNASSSKYTYINNNSVTNTITESATAMDTDYHTFEISQAASSVLYSIDGAAATTVSTNPPNASEYIRLENTDASNAVNVDYVYVRKYIASAPSAGAAGTEEQGKGPVGYWSLDDGQGTNAQDSSSSGNDGTITGATWQPEDRCVAGKCLYFDGTDDIVSLSDSANLSPGSSNYTIEAWVKTNLVDSAGHWVYGDYGTTTNNLAALFINTDNKFHSFYRDGEADAADAASTTTPVANKWYHVAAVRNGTTSYIYVNGVQENSNTNASLGTITTSDGNVPKMGVLANGSSQYWKGFMDDVKVYPYARTTAEIKTDYDAGKANAAANSGTSAALGSQTQDYLSNGLISYWKMDDAGIDAEGETITDSSGNSNTGTLYGDNGVGDNGTGLDCTAAGKYGTGCNLTGTDDYINITDTNLPTGANPRTISAWVNTSSGSLQQVFSYGAGSSGQAFTLGTWGAQIFVSGWSSPQYQVTATNLNNGSWHLITLSYDGTNASTYMDGVLLDKRAASFNTVANAGKIGARRDAGTEFFNGTIDEVRVYNRVLSSKEVTDLYNWAPGPVGYWKMDDKVSGDSKTIVDTSTSGNNASTVDGANNTGMDCTKIGKYGGACQFDGTDDYIDATNNSSLRPKNAFTVSAWIKPKGTQAAFVGIAGNQNTYSGYLLRYDSSGTTNRLNSRIGNGTANFDAASTAAISPNTWTHVSLVFNGTQVIYYFNGAGETPLTSTVNSIDYTNATNLMVGADSALTADRYFNGQIDDLKIYNYARSAKQIVEDMNGGHPAVGTPVGSAVGHWKFDEGQGQTANNSGSQGSTLNGTLGANSGSSTDDPSWSQAGKFGKALSFDGGDYIEAADNDAFDPTEITISAWFNPTSLAAASVPISHGNNTSGWYLQLNTNGTLSFYTGSSGKTSVKGTLSTGSWQHVIITHDGVNDKFYINGKLTDTLAQTTAITNLAQVFRMGRWSNGDYYYTGLLDEVKIYRFALTPDQVKTEFNRGQSMQLGALGTNSTYAAGAANQEYCVPGDATSCAPPVAGWDFEEGRDNTCSGGSNDVCDKSGNGNDGAWSGTGSHWASGKIGKAGKLNGSDDYITVADSSTLNFGTGDFTVEMWAKTAVVDVTDQMKLMIRIQSSPTRTWAVWMDSGEKINFTTYDGSYHHATSNNTLNDGKWHYIVGVLQNGVSGGQKLYIDGVLQTTTTTSSPNNDISSITYIGEDNDGSRKWNGSIDQIKVFNYARSAAQVAWDYNRGGPVGHWKLDECQGGTAYDSSGNKNNGTITIGASGEDTLGTCTTSSTAWGTGATGKRNASLSFGGTDDYIAVSSTGLIGNSKAITVSAWVNTTSTGGVIYGEGNVSSSNPIIQMEISSSKMYAFIRDDAGTYNLVQNSGPNITNGGWTHMAMTVDANGKITGAYINGKLIGSATANTLSTLTTTNTKIGTLFYGAYPSGYDFFNGQIDDVKVFNYALTATQIKNEYNNGAVFFGPSTGSP